MITDPKIFDRFFNILEIKPAKPSLELLKRTVSSHLEKISFENISKLIYRKEGKTDIPDLARYLTGIEENNFG